MVTELNFSRSDVLGIVREVLPALNDLVKTLASSKMDLSKQSDIRISPETLAKLDFGPVAEAIEGVTNIRLLVANYRAPQMSADPATLFDSAATKAGAASKVISDASGSIMPGVAALYALPDSGGYIGYAYDAARGKILAGRLSGKADIAKLVKWAGDLAKVFIDSSSEPPGTLQKDEPESSSAPESSESGSN